jgi:hypothetical protein
VYAGVEAGTPTVRVNVAVKVLVESWVMLALSEAVGPEGEEADS